MFLQNEIEQSAYNFEHANVDALLQTFEAAEAEAQNLSELGLPLPAYEKVLRASHTFNLLDARRAISVTERQGYILRIRTQAKLVADAYFTEREKLEFPLIKKYKAAQNG